MRKPVILTFVGYYLPGYKAGGPMRSVSNMVAMLSHKLDFRIITSDRDLGDAQPYSNVVIDAWNTVGKAQVFYASSKKRTLRSFARLIMDTPHDVLYLNSFFSPVFTQRPLLARWLGLIPKRPTIIAPRGEFSEGALALKAWKKHPYIAMIQQLGIYRDITWQASSEYEAEAIRKAMGRTAKRIVLAPVLPNYMSDNLLSVTEGTCRGKRSPGDPLRVCFLSRISPKKNLDYALRVLADVKVPVEFDIYGVAENADYWEHCRKLEKNLPAHVAVRYHGEINHENVMQALAMHDLFFLPTRGENFGHVIFEALAAGLPVLLSDQTPWRDLEALGVGWDLPLMAEEKFRAVIEAQAELHDEEREAQRYRVQQYVKRIALDSHVVPENLMLFEGLLEGEQEAIDNRKPVILTFVGYYLPGYKAGGPVRTVSNMVAMLSNELDFRIITSDRDLGDAQPYSNVVIDAWNTVGKAQVFYASSKKRTLRSFARLIMDTPHDVLYLNSFFSPVFTQRPLLARWLGLIPKRPTIVAPRGEFSEGALALKAWKKHPYIAMIKQLGIYRDITWQASSEYEAEAIRKAIGRTAKRIVLAIFLAANIPDILKFTTEGACRGKRSPGDPLRVCFLSRISPMKNLDYALRVLADVKVPVEFDIYGVAENADYWERCRKLEKNLPAHVAVRYHGEINHENVMQALAMHDLFFLPTRGENFGHVIFEALAAGLPVLLSDQTPWRDLEALGVGWDLPLMAEEKFRAVIEAQAELHDEEREAQRYRAQEYAMSIAMNDQVRTDNLALFQGVMSGKQIIMPYLRD